MNKHLKHFKYTVLHKWYVFKACLRYGLIWRGIKHDWTKFTPSEWFAYANYDFSKGLPNNTGYIHQFRPDEIAFNVSMNHHHKRNTHHWEYWVLVNKDGTTMPLPMPDADRKEMVADWLGAGLAQGRPKVWEWYEANKDKVQLHPDTRKWVEAELAKLATSFDVSHNIA